MIEVVVGGKFKREREREEWVAGIVDRWWWVIAVWWWVAGGGSVVEAKE